MAAARRAPWSARTVFRFCFRASFSVLEHPWQASPRPGPISRNVTHSATSDTYIYIYFCERRGHALLEINNNNNNRCPLKLKPPLPLALGAGEVRVALTVAAHRSLSLRECSRGSFIKATWFILDVSAKRFIQCHTACAVRVPSFRWAGGMYKIRKNEND